MPADDDTLPHYALWAVFRRDPTRPFRGTGTGDLDAAIADLEAEGVKLRGIYDVSGLRADADLMLWLHGTRPEQVQAGLRRLRRTDVLRNLLPVWNAMGVHRDAEFNHAHVPGFLRGVDPKQWLVVYPFVRSYEWYLLPEEERRAMLAEHGRRGAAFTGVIANTVAAFALGDYEWVLPMEADDLVDLVDMMRDLRYTEARRHVREEVPFFTGRRIPTAAIAEVLE